MPIHAKKASRYYRGDSFLRSRGFKTSCNDLSNNNNNNNPICKAPECQKTSVALADRNSRAN